MSVYVYSYEYKILTSNKTLLKGKESQPWTEKSEQRSQNVSGRVDLRSGELPHFLFPSITFKQLKEHLAHVVGNLSG